MGLMSLYLQERHYLALKKFVEKEISVPIIDCAEAAVKQAELAVTMAGKILNKKRNFKLPPKNSNGLEENLAKYISHNL